MPSGRIPTTISSCSPRSAGPISAASRCVPVAVATRIGHAELLARVLPEQRDRLQTLTTAIAAAEQRRVDAWAVHGDLYEAQLVTAVDSPRIVGVLDLDDAGPGDPIDDRATVLAHLWSRGANPATAAASSSTSTSCV